MTRLSEPMRWLSEGIPLTLLMDLLDPSGLADPVTDPEPLASAYAGRRVAVTGRRPPK